MARYINCILKTTKLCDDCGECDICDLDRTKMCDNCGKCMENGNSDYREVLVDHIYDADSNDSSEEIELINTNISEEDDENLNETDYELIDDIDGLSEIMEDPEHEYIEEVFPGLLKLKKRSEK